MDCSPPGFSVHGVLQARLLEWVAISFSRGSSQPRDWTWVPCMQVDSLPSKPPGKPKCLTRVSYFPYSFIFWFSITQPNIENYPYCCFLLLIIFYIVYHLHFAFWVPRNAHLQGRAPVSIPCGSAGGFLPDVGSLGPRSGLANFLWRVRQ